MRNRVTGYIESSQYKKLSKEEKIAHMSEAIELDEQLLSSLKKKLENLKDEIHFIGSGVLTAQAELSKLNREV